MRTKSTIDSTDACAISRHCLEAANSVGAAVSVAIVDESGMLLRFERMDRVPAHTIELAMRKARSAATTGVPTRMIDAAVKAGKLLNVDAIGWGGVPVKANGECVGAIGVSGSTSEVDEEIASAAAAAFMEHGAEPIATAAP